MSALEDSWKYGKSEDKYCLNKLFSLQNAHNLKKTEGEKPK